MLARDVFDVAKRQCQNMQKNFTWIKFAFAFDDVLLPVRGLKTAKNVPKIANVGVFCHF